MTDTTHVTRYADPPCDESLKSGANLGPSGEKKCDIQTKYIASCDTQFGLTSVSTDTAHVTRYRDPPWDESLKSVAKPGQSREHKSNLPPKYIAKTNTQSIVTCVLTDSSHETHHPDHTWMDGVRILPFCQTHSWIFLLLTDGVGLI